MNSDFNGSFNKMSGKSTFEFLHGFFPRHVDGALRDLTPDEEYVNPGILQENA